jgi:hypothetical protein
MRYYIDVYVWKNEFDKVVFKNKKGDIKCEKKPTNTDIKNEYFVEYDDFGVFLYKGEPEKTFTNTYPYDGDTRTNYKPNKTIKYIYTRKLKL